MSQQREAIEILRDCMSLLRDLEFVELDGKTKTAIQRYATETIDQIVRPLYPPADDKKD